MSYKPLVYVAHPCGGLIRKNRKECRQILKVLTKILAKNMFSLAQYLILATCTMTLIISAALKPALTFCSAAISCC